MLASSLFIKPTRCSSTSGPWHLLLSLPGTLLLRLMAYSLTSSRFSFKYYLPNASLPWLLALLPIIWPIPSLLYFFSKNISSTSKTLDIIFIHASCLSSPLECQHYKRRDFCLFWPLLCSRAYGSCLINIHWMNIVHSIFAFNECKYSFNEYLLYDLLYDFPLLLEFVTQAFVIWFSTSFRIILLYLLRNGYFYHIFFYNTFLNNNNKVNHWAVAHTSFLVSKEKSAQCHDTSKEPSKVMRQRTVGTAEPLSENTRASPHKRPLKPESLYQNSPTDTAASVRRNVALKQQIHLKPELWEASQHSMVTKTHDVCQERTDLEQQQGPEEK